MNVFCFFFFSFFPSLPSSLFIHTPAIYSRLTFVFYEQMKRMALARNRAIGVSDRHEEMVQLFEQWGSNSRGTLSTTELNHMIKFVFPPSVNDMFMTNLQHQQYLEQDLAYLTQKYRLEDEIDFKAFETLAKQLETSMREHQLKEAFAFFDTKGDGFIDRDELYFGLSVLEFPHRDASSGHLKEDKVRRLTDHLMALGDPSNLTLISFSSFGAVHDEIRAYQIKKQIKVDNMDHTV